MWKDQSNFVGAPQCFPLHTTTDYISIESCRNSTATTCDSTKCIWKVGSTTPVVTTGSCDEITQPADYSKRTCFGYKSASACPSTCKWNEFPAMKKPLFSEEFCHPVPAVEGEVK
jgi:hypothetical protein